MNNRLTNMALDAKFTTLLVSCLMITYLVTIVTADDDIDFEGERTFGHFAKPLKKLTNSLGHYLVQATSDYYPTYQYHPTQFHPPPYSGYYGSHHNNYVGHRPGYFPGYRVEVD